MSQSRCDVIDVLEEAQHFHTRVVVHLSDGRVFEDRVQDISAYEGEDHVAFAHHELTPLRRIRSAERAVLRTSSRA